MTEGKLGLLWTETHRPVRLDQLALEPATRALLASYLDAGEVPHLLFVGPPGSGKTTVSRILLDKLDCRELALNASVDRGIDTVRTKIGGFVTSMLSARWNIVFLDEADAMTGDAQTSLRNLIEAHADRARFILTCNYEHKIIPAIQSRCQKITLAAPPLAERVKVLKAVLDAEGIQYQVPILFGWAERYPDMRAMLFGAQKAWLASGKGELPQASAMDVATGSKVWELIGTKNWTGLKGLTKNGDFDPAQALRDLFWAIPDGPTAAIQRKVVGRAVHDSAFTPDPPILFLATCAELMEG